MSLLDDIDNEMSWREKEIASMRILLNSPGLTEGQRNSMMRAAWALLYAHYEGFCKNTLNIFYEAVSNTAVTCGELPEKTRLFALERRLKSLKQLDSEGLFSAITEFEANDLSLAPVFPEVSAQSNLWPNLLISLYEAADLDTSCVVNNNQKLKSLVNTRNEIAHGEYNIINDLSYYYTYEEAVYNVIYDLALQVDERISRDPYST